MKPWRFVGVDAAAAFTDVEKVVKAYPPGQKDIDGGGFKIVKSDASSGYLYAQFESLKRGYIDDVEFLLQAAPGASEGELQLRSASRLGYLDMGVNAKRLNKLAEGLSEIDGGKRWTAPKITGERFPRYVQENR